MQQLRDRPAGDKNREAAPSAQPVDNVTRTRIHDGVREEEQREDVRVVLFVEREFAADIHRNHSDGLAIQVVNQSREAQQEGDRPTKLRNLHMVVAHALVRAAFTLV